MVIVHITYIITYYVDILTIKCIYTFYIILRMRVLKLLKIYILVIVKRSYEFNSNEKLSNMVLVNINL